MFVCSLVGLLCFVCLDVYFITLPKLDVFGLGTIGKCRTLNNPPSNFMRAMSKNNNNLSFSSFYVVLSQSLTNNLKS